MHKFSRALQYCMLHYMQRTVLPRLFCPSVCPSVKRVHCDKTEETCVTFLYRMKERLS